MSGISVKVTLRTATGVDVTLTTEGHSVSVCSMRPAIERMLEEAERMRTGAPREDDAPIAAADGSVTLPHAALP